MTPAERIAELFRTHRQYLGLEAPLAVEKQIDFEYALGPLICELLGRHDPVASNDADPAFDHCTICDRVIEYIGLERDPENPGTYRKVTQ